MTMIDASAENQAGGKDLGCHPVISRVRAPRSVDFEIVAAIVPVGQHEPLARSAVDDRVVPRRTMRVAVDHPRDAGAAKRALDRAGIDVE